MEQRTCLKSNKTTNKKEKVNHTACMKIVKLKSSIFVGLTLLLLLFPWVDAWKASSIKDITKPYLGVYECREAKLDDKDYLEKFDYIRLELKSKNNFLLSYKAKGEKVKEEKGSFAYDKKTQTITFQADAIPFMKRKFPLKDGRLLINVAIGEKTLQMRFEQL